MRLVGVAIVKNEADVIEAFVRHAVHYLDRLVVIDHLSDDATPRVLAGLRDEGLPLELRRMHEVGFDHARAMTDALRLAAGLVRADHYLALDADEFLRCPSPAALRETLSLIPPTAPGYLRWQTQVTGPDADAAPATHVLRRLTHRLAHEPAAQHKVVLPHALAGSAGWTVATGNHWVLSRDGARIDGVALEGATLAHLPLRSPAQVVRKAVIGWLGHRLALGPRARELPLNWHWRGLYERILSGRFPHWEDLPALAAAAYSSELPGSAPPSLALVHDPLPIHAELRWPEFVDIDPLLAILRWTDRLIEAGAR